MQGSQLIQLTKSLSKRDFRELRKVVRSPYFNQREDVIQLYDYIEKVFNEKLPDFSKEKAFKKLFPNKKFDDVLMRQLMSYLLKVIEKYLITEGVLQDDLESQLQLTHALRFRNADKLFEKQLAQFSESIESQGFKNAKYHYMKFKMHLEEHNYRGDKKRTGELNLQSLSDELDYFYIAERMRYASLIHAHQAVTNHNYQQPLLGNTVEYINKMEEVPPSISAYFHAYKTLTQPENVESFNNLRQIIVEKGNLFPERERKDLYVLATNYCIRQLNNGEKLYGLEALKLYQARMKNNVLLENGVLPHYTYKNILMLAIKAEQDDWAENFLNEFKQYLPEKDRENIYNYNLALFYFRKGKQHYGEAMSLLQIVNLTDVLYNLDARRLLTIIYFEHNDFQALQSHIESSKIYLHRHKDIGYHHDMYVNFFRFLEKIQKINMRDTKAKEILRGEMTSTQLLAERDWLINKLN
jgi:hypothetical protein